MTGSVILRYVNEEAANAAVERLKGHPIQTSSGVTKHLGAKHATPPKWVVQRKAQEDEARLGYLRCRRRRHPDSFSLFFLNMLNR